MCSDTTDISVAGVFMQVHVSFSRKVLSGYMPKSGGLLGHMEVLCIVS